MLTPPPMSFTKDLHLCGTCKKIFNDLNLFLEHKSQCSYSQINVVFSPNPYDITLENGLFCNETVLDLTVLDNGSILPILHCENEEVVTDAADCQTEEDTFPKSSSEKTQPHLEKVAADQVSKSIDEKDIANFLATQLSTENIKNSIPQHQIITAPEKLPQNLPATHSSNKENSTVESEQDEIPVENVTKRGQKNICKICNFVSAYHKDLVRHMRKHTGERPFICPFCNKKFARQDKLIIHKRIHLGDKRYKCQLCDYATADGGALKKHSQIHTDERPYKCQICPYRARNSSHMIVHLRTHTGDSPFFCKIESCGKTFKTSTDLNRHMKVHKLYSVAPSCSFDEENSKNSCKHLRKNGKLFMKSPSCLICQDFMHKGAVKMKRRVSRNRAFCVQPHQCSACGAKFVRPDSIRSHLKLHRELGHEAHDSTKHEDNGSADSLSPTKDSSPEVLPNTSPGLQGGDAQNIDGSLLL